MLHLHVLHGARLGNTQYVEQLQDQLLDVLQGILLRQEVWVDLLLYLNVGDKDRDVRDRYSNKEHPVTLKLVEGKTLSSALFTWFNVRS